MAIIFTDPKYLFLLFLIPLAIFIHLFAIKVTKKKSIKFANFDALSKIKGVEIFSKNVTLLYIDILIILLVVLALSGFSVTKRVSATNTAFVLAIDASGSMSADDITPTRLEAAKEASLRLLEVVPEKTKMGVIAFSGSSYIEEGLTEDKNKLTLALNRIQEKQIGGTDMYEAIITATNMLRNEESGVILLMSDGQTSLDNLLGVIDYVNQNQVRIYSLGIGTEKGGITNTGSVSKIKEEVLKALAFNTDGRYYRIESIDEFYKALGDSIEITEKEDVQDLKEYLILAALALFFIEFILSNTKFRVLP